MIDVPYLDLEDLPGMEAEARRAVKALGFVGQGRDPPQADRNAMNAVFAPDTRPTSPTRSRVVAGPSRRADTGLVVIDGKLIEKPVLRDMHRIVAIADRVRA